MGRPSGAGPLLFAPEISCQIKGSAWAFGFAHGRKRSGEGNVGKVTRVEVLGHALTGAPTGRSILDCSQGSAPLFLGASEGGGYGSRNPDTPVFSVMV